MAAPDMLDELARLNAARTKGPWQRVKHREWGRTIYQIVTDGQTGDVAGDGHGYIAELSLRMSRARDAEFIAFVANHADQLIARVRQAEGEAERLRELLGLEHHIFETNPSGWAIQHPLACRPDMLACPISQASMELDEPPVTDGRWRVDLDEHGDLQFSALAGATHEEGTK